MSLLVGNSNTSEFVDAVEQNKKQKLQLSYETKKICSCSLKFSFSLNHLPILNTLLCIVISHKTLNMIYIYIYGCFYPTYKLTH